jgi:thioredoxin-dependent peroxiredoxin
VVYGASKDSLNAQEKFAGKYELELPLLSDTGGRVRALYGNPDGADEPASRITYVIDASGVVREIFGVPRIGADEHPPAALQAVRALAG